MTFLVRDARGVLRPATVAGIYPDGSIAIQLVPPPGPVVAIPKAMVDKANRKPSDWRTQHGIAYATPNRGHERALVHLVQGLHEYARAHCARYESDVGGDGVLGPAFLDIARGVIALLNGESGRLDCGTLDSEIRDLLARSGFPAHKVEGL